MAKRHAPKMQAIKIKSIKFLKPGKGTGPKEGAHVAVFPKGTTGEEIVAFWLSEMKKTASAEEAKK
jgi:hypothetical protein